MNNEKDLETLTYKNMLIRIPKKDREAKVKGIIVNEAPKAYRVGEVVSMGEEVDKRYKDKSVGVFVQSLEYEFDINVKGMNQKEYNYFLIHEQNIIGIFTPTNDNQFSV